jgi:hypothetical protein
MQLFRMDVDGTNQIQMTNDENWNSWFFFIFEEKYMMYCLGLGM